LPARLPRREPIAEVFDFDMDDPVIAQETPHLRVADLSGVEDEVLMRQPHAGKAHGGRCFDALSQRERTDFGRTH
jgi:hypothetical protein